MASEKNLAVKQTVIDEFKGKVQGASTYVLFDYRGLTDGESKELRTKLRETGSDYKIYKNTLMERAFNDLNIDLKEFLVGPSAVAFSEDQIAPIKVLTDFAKTHPALILKVGVVDGEVSDKEQLKQLASIPSRDGLLTMLAAGMIAIPKDLAVALNMYAEELSDGSPVEEPKTEEVTEAPVEEAPVEQTEEPVEETTEEQPAEQTEAVEETVEEN